jgi:hypothetical protein
MEAQYPPSGGAVQAGTRQPRTGGSNPATMPQVDPLTVTAFNYVS